jgi:hypothetical protein
MIEVFILRGSASFLALGVADIVIAALAENSRVAINHAPAKRYTILEANEITKHGAFTTPKTLRG